MNPYLTVALKYKQGCLGIFTISRVKAGICRHGDPFGDLCTSYFQRFIIGIVQFSVIPDVVVGINFNFKIGFRLKRNEMLQKPSKKHVEFHLNNSKIKCIEIYHHSPAFFEQNLARRHSCRIQTMFFSLLLIWFTFFFVVCRHARQNRLLLF